MAPPFILTKASQIISPIPRPSEFWVAVRFSLPNILKIWVISTLVMPLPESMTLVYNI